MSVPKTDAEIQAMRKSGEILASILDVMRSESTPGMTPKDMSDLAKTGIAPSWRRTSISWFPWSPRSSRLP